MLVVLNPPDTWPEFSKYYGNIRRQWTGRNFLVRCKNVNDGDLFWSSGGAERIMQSGQEGEWSEPWWDLDCFNDFTSSYDVEIIGWCVAPTSDLDPPEG